MWAVRLCKYFVLYAPCASGAVNVCNFCLDDFYAAYINFHSFIYSFMIYSCIDAMDVFFLSSSSFNKQWEFILK